MTGAPPLVCAHRGVSAHFPENTLRAIAEVANIGVPLTEIDVRRTVDGHVVLHHDETVDRTTNGSGAVSALTLDEIRALDAGAWKSERFAGERVPTFAEVLALCRERGLSLVTEIKQLGIVSDVVRLINEHRMVERSLVISFNFATVCEVRRANGRIATGWLTSSIDPDAVDDLLGQLLTEGIPVVSSLYTQVTPKIVERCRRRGITLFVWTIDEEDVARHYAEMGVDVITSNRPQEIMAALR
ncbi:MAG: glycerophosphodiester phosphodiesterase [Candidatus Zipacnadales bacterium]